MRERSRWGWLVVAALVAATGCRDSTSPVPAELVGHYELQSVNGDTLPTLFTESGGERYTVDVGRMSLRADHGFEQALYFTVTGGSQPTAIRQASGSFEASGDHVAFTEKLGARYTATVGPGPTLTYSFGTASGITLVWTRTPS